MRLQNKQIDSTDSKDSKKYEMIHLYFNAIQSRQALLLTAENG
jgi:hypothetical protein